MRFEDVATTQPALLGSPADFCTIAYAAETIGISQRYVRDLIKIGKLAAANPKIGSLESGRRHALLYVSQVHAYAAARKMLSKTSGKPLPSSA